MPLTALRKPQRFRGSQQVTVQVPASWAGTAMQVAIVAPVPQVVTSLMVASQVDGTTHWPTCPP